MKVLSLALLVSTFIGLCHPALSASLDDVLRRLEAVEAENKTLRSRVRSLEHGSPAKKAIRQQQEVAQLPGQLLNPVPAETAKPSSFDGFYAGVFGGIASAKPQGGQPTISGYVIEPSTYPNSYNYSYLSKRVGGGSLAGGFAGYGATLGHLYFGFEGRGYLSESRTSVLSQDSRYSAYFPMYAYSGNTSSFLLSSSQDTRKTASVAGGGDVSGRIGIARGNDWLVYGRLGAGLSIIEGTATQYNTRTTCTSPIVTTTVVYGYSYSNITGCGATSSTSTTQKRATSLVSPYIVAGLGLEKNFGPIFARAEGEIINNLGSTVYKQNSFNDLSVSPYYDLRLTAAVGYRW